MRWSGPVPPLVVFTDLDGTLLRHEDYDWSEAGEALAALAAHRIPCVIASSKTRSEIDVWRERLGLTDPYISENGGALHFPAGADSAGETVRLGVSYVRLREALDEIGRELGVALRGFGDMTAGEIAALTGLAGGDLERARQREHDEPFLPARPLTSDEEARLDDAALSRGLRVTRGGRLHHLLGAHDKGMAARVLLSTLSADGAAVRSLGVGDAANDLELLRAVTRAIVVARPDGTHDPELVAGLPGARFVHGIGPAGFNEGVLAELPGPSQ